MRRLALQRNHAVEHDEPERQEISDVFDFDWYGSGLLRKADMQEQPQRKLSAVEWEQKLREEDKASKQSRAKRMRDDVEVVAAKTARHSKFSWSGAGAEKQEGSLHHESTMQIPVDQKEVERMKHQGMDVSALQSKKSMALNLDWSREETPEEDFDG